MRAVVQRVKKASVAVNKKTTGEIGQGLLVLLGVGEDDTRDDLEYMLNKIPNLRIFNDKDGKMNLSLLDIEGDLLVVSQFTLYGDARKGRRPNFIESASPNKAKAYYENFIDEVKTTVKKVETGEFGADMDVELINDGPVTILLDSKRNF